MTKYNLGDYVDLYVDCDGRFCNKGTAVTTVKRLITILPDEVSYFKEGAANYQFAVKLEPEDKPLGWLATQASVVFDCSEEQLKKLPRPASSKEKHYAIYAKNIASPEVTKPLNKSKEKNPSSSQDKFGYWVKVKTETGEKILKVVAKLLNGDVDYLLAVPNDYGSLSFNIDDFSKVVGGCAVIFYFDYYEKVIGVNKEDIDEDFSYLIDDNYHVGDIVYCRKDSFGITEVLKNKKASELKKCQIVRTRSDLEVYTVREMDGLKTSHLVHKENILGKHIPTLSETVKTYEIGDIVAVKVTDSGDFSKEGENISLYSIVGAVTNNDTKTVHQYILSATPSDSNLAVKMAIFNRYRTFPAELLREIGKERDDSKTSTTIAPDYTGDCLYAAPEHIHCLASELDPSMEDKLFENKLIGKTKSLESEKLQVSKEIEDLTKKISSGLGVVLEADDKHSNSTTVKFPVSRNCVMNQVLVKVDSNGYPALNGTEEVYLNVRYIDRNNKYVVELQNGSVVAVAKENTIRYVPAFSEERDKYTNWNGGGFRLEANATSKKDFTLNPPVDTKVIEESAILEEAFLPLEGVTSRGVVIEDRNLKLSNGPVEPVGVHLGSVKKEKTMNKFIDTVKDDAADASYRVAAHQISKATRTGILKLLKDSGAKRSQIKAISELLDSEAGLAVLSFLMGFGLNYVPNVKDNPKAKRLAKEFRVGGMTAGGNLLAGSVIETLVPMLMTQLEALPEPGKVRVAAPTESKAEITVEEEAMAEEEAELAQTSGKSRK